MMELVDIRDLKSLGATPRASSILAPGTTPQLFFSLFLQKIEEGKQMKLSIKGLTLAGGILWALGMLVVGILNIISPGYGGEFLKIMASVYPGYKASGQFVDVIFGTLYALVDGAICGFVFALLYNTFVGTASKKRRT
jgi:hypothetical protein